MIPNLLEFDPRVIPSQIKVIRDVRQNIDYSIGTHEILLSGSVGSSKSALIAHLALTHCLMNKNAHFGIGRLSMPALKGTLFATICEHIPDAIPHRVKEIQAQIFFPNGSKITSYSWQDKRYKKVRSHEFSSFAIEELTENDTDDAYKEIFMRIGRNKDIQEKFLISATNPDDPTHWAYDRFFIEKSPTRHVYLSNTFENPFLPPSYVEDLRRNLSPREARRMLHGEWLELSRDVIYYEYQPDQDYTDEKYEVDPRYPIYWTHDFNIGQNKPMSSCFFQYIGDKFHIFAEIVVPGARTQDICDEAVGRNLFSYKTKYIVTGDAAGRHNDTRSKLSDYRIIEGTLANLKPTIPFEINAPLSNPPIRDRHNLVNAYCKNDLGQRRLKIYQCKTLDKGLRLTKLKDNGHYIEDDSKPWQHITTALGYGINQALQYNKTTRPTMIPR